MTRLAPSVRERRGELCGRVADDVHLPAVQHKGAEVAAVVARELTGVGAARLQVRADLHLDRRAQGEEEGAQGDHSDGEKNDAGDRVEILFRPFFAHTAQYASPEIQASKSAACLTPLDRVHALSNLV